MNQTLEYNQLRNDYIGINSRYQLLFEKSLNPIAVTDKEFRFTEVNQAFCDMLGYSKSEVLELSMPHVSYKDSADESIYLIQQMIEGEIEDFSIMKKYRKKDGTLVNANTAVKALRDQFGNYEGSIASIEVLTIEKLSVMQSSINQLEDFARLVSHDLRAPLTNVMGLIALLKENPALTESEECNKILNMISKSSERMSRMISEILNKALTDKDKELDSIADYRLNEIVDDVLENLHFEIDRLYASVNCSDLYSVTGYYSQLIQLFQNLISNCLKFRKEDVPLEIDISASKIDRGVRFVVSDNGIGIPEKDIQHVFTQFYRADHDNYVGFGLGLTACKKIVMEYGGSISISSKVNEGTSVTFTLLDHI